MPVQAQSPQDGVCDRTEEIRDAIVSAVTGVTDCAEITETQLGQITTLTLFAVNITALAADDLLGLSGLVKLNLAYNGLTALPPMVFDDLTSLDTLWLNNNQLQTLSAGIFAGLTGLDDLKLASNPGFPFGPVAEAGPTFFVSTDAAVTLQGSGGSDPWGRSVTYAWTQSDSSGVVVSLDGYTTATPSLTAPAVEQETAFRFKLTVTAVDPGGVAPPGTTTAGDSATDSTQVWVQAAVPVSVYFHRATYVATEGGSAATVAIRLDQIPRRSVSIPLKAVAAGGADAADYSIPASVTFGYVDRVKYVTVTATDDSVDDDGESLTLSFGESLPAAVARGSPSSVTVDLADNDEPVGVRISGLSVTSDPGTDSVYVIGDTLEVTATFSETVMVSGQPQLTLSVGTRITELLGQAARNAGYVRGSGTTQLAFAYGVVAGDNDPDGVSVATGSLDLNSGSIQARDSTDAVLAHDGLALQPGHTVDALAPTLGAAFVDGSGLTLRYSEPLDDNSVPSPSAFSVRVGGASRTVSDVGVSGKLVNVTLATAVQPGEEASVGYTVPMTGTIRDKVGLAATAFSNQSATNYTLPTVSIAAVDPNVYEGVDVDFTLTRNGPAIRSLQATVRVQDSGDVLVGTSGDRNVTFAAGDSTAWLTLKTHDDHGYEAHATVSATAIGGEAYHVSETAGTASVTVSDNDWPEIDVTLSAPDSVAEEVDTFVVQVSAKTVSDEEPHGSLSVRLRSSDSTANAGSDYSSVSEIAQFLPADFTRIEEGDDGHYVATASQAVTIFDDSMQEDDETFALELTRSVIIGEDVNLPLEPLVVTIVDNDTLPPPGKVSGLSVTEGNAQLALSWSAVGGATGYKVQWKSGTETFADAATDGRQHVVSSGTTTAHTITGLTNGTPYTVRVIATNSAGDGPASDERTGSPGALATRPGRVSGLSVTEGNAQLALSWSAVGGATGYKVQWKSGTETFADAATDGRQHVVSSGTTTAHTITGLTNGTPYTVRVIATNSAGDGPASDERTGSPGALATRPGRVSGLSVTEGNAQLALSWSAVGGATGYKVQWKSGTETFADAATDGRQHVVSSGTTTAHTITGLANGTPYTVRVIATNSAGDGPASDERTGSPGALATRPGRVSGLSVTEGNAQLALSWSAVGGATGYKVQWKSGTETFADAATDGRQHVVSSGTTTAHTITGLANGTPYTVRVIATNSAGDGPASDEKTGTPTAQVATPGLRVTTLAMSLREGDSNTYGVALGSAPGGSVTVTVGGWPGTDVQVEPTSLVFTTSDWSAWQTVTVTVRQNDHYESTHEVALTHSSGTGVAGPWVKVTVIDDDGPLPSVSMRALSDSVKEGEVVWFELTRTAPVGGALRGGIFVFDLEKGPFSDAMVAFYFQPGDARDRISYRVKIDTLVTTDRTVKATINPSFDGYEQGSPREATVRVIDRTGSQTSGDMASETGVAFSGAPLKATEGEDITVVVRLSEPAEAGVTIPLAVSGLGGANDEDWDVPSEVVIEGGDSLGAVLISAVDDAEEDPGESLELSFGTLPQGFTAEDPRKVVVDIEDNDQFRMGAEETRGWLVRFGRAVSGEAVEAVRERMTAGLRPSAESRMRLGGHDLSAWKAAMFSGGGRAGVAPEPAPGRGVTSSRAGSQAREFFGRLLSGTSFSRTGAFGQSASGRWSVWGRGGVSSFGGRDGDLSLSGDVTTVTLGADYGSGRALGGVVLSRSTADGSLASGNDPGGQVETTLTSAYPWMRYALTERISVWGMGGYGAGSMPGSPGDAGAGSDVEMRMGALGAAGQLVSTRALALALSSDALFTRTSAAGATMPGDVEADVSRVRLMLEGSSSIEVAGGTLRPTFEVGFRQDGGDAETGVGLEAGGGFGYSLPSLGLAVEGRVRGLIAHEDDGYDEWGASGSVRIVPDPSGRGLKLKLSPSWGSAGPGGARALWSRRDMTGIATRPGGTSGLDSGSVALDLGYGLAVSRQIIATPYGGTMDGARRLGLSVRTGPSLEMKLETVEGNGHGGLLLNAAYRPGAFFRLSLAGRRNTAGGMSLGLTGQLGGR